MPRKTNGIVFELHPGPQKDADGKPLLYARPAAGRKRKFEEIDDFCARYRHTTPGEMKRLFSLFMDVAGMWLAKGYRIETPIGSFALKLKLLGDHTDPARVTGKDIMYSGVEFTPSREFVETAGMNREGFRRSEHTVGNSQMYDTKAMEEALRVSMKAGYTTVTRFMHASGLKRDSAQKFLDGLSTGPDARLRRTQDGKTYVYTLRQKAQPFGE